MTYPIYHGITLAAQAAFENLVIENLAADPVAPEEGRVWYNGTEKVYRMSVTDDGGAQKTLTFQDKEAFAEFLTQLSSTVAESSGASKVGYDGATGTNTLFSVEAGQLDKSLDTIVQAIDDEKQARTVLESQADNEGAIKVGYQGKAGAKGIFSIDRGTLKDALDKMVDQIDLNAEASSVSSQAIQDELDATQAAAGLDAAGAYTPDETSNYLKTADFTAATRTASLKDADALLDAQAKSIDDDLQAYKTANDTALTNYLLKAGDTMSGNLNMGEFAVKSAFAPQDANDLTNKAYVDSVATGLDVKNSCRVASVSVINNLAGDLQDNGDSTYLLDGISLVDGDRVLVKNTASIDGVEAASAIHNGIYTVALTLNDSGTDVTAVFTRATDADTDAKVSSGMFTFVEEGAVGQNNGYVLVTDGVIDIGLTELNFEQFSGAGQVIAGAGISKNGNELFLNFGAGITETPDDEIGIDFGAGLFTTEDGVTDSTGAAAKLEIKVDGNTLVKSATGLKVSDDIVNATGNAQAELDLTQAGAGLNDQGNYVAATAANYIASETSIHGATVKLDTELKGTSDRLDTEVSNREAGDTALQTELDAVQTGAGLEANGEYIADPTADVIKTALSLKGADKLLNDKALEIDGKLSQEVTDRATDDTAIRNGVGLLVSGAMPDVSATNYLKDTTDIFAALVSLDTAVNAGLTKASQDTANVVTQLNANKYVYDSWNNATQKSEAHVIEHNLNSEHVNVTVWVQREDNGKFYNDLALVTQDSNNQLTVNLTAPLRVKVAIEAIRDFTDPTA
ncbi:hypothetical protein [Pseudoalteromonas umbrosa]|uniref:hypothetical protein n=1 Tax=Pseudoalteromonas umbrosa TaxID=3048489 RepID=UPI0024C31052|nr:hypothetical protein [Pseudoalteromonas sp. B95]MDK1290235.1 hypothetical protein [Pseudoalteromonas sp. B95]